MTDLEGVRRLSAAFLARARGLRALSPRARRGGAVGQPAPEARRAAGGACGGASAGGAFAHAAPETRALTAAVVAQREKLLWWNPYKAGQPAGRNFYDRAAGCLLAGAGGPFVPTTGRSGFFFIRQGVEYAPHAHEPREIYAVLAGRARFWDDQSGWTEAGAGSVVHTPAHSWHALETPDSPVLILWAWIGEGLHDLPRFRDATAAMPA
jgi:mannose-6-phosphate isomerase-like protein (cupin superfamily)